MNMLLIFGVVVLVVLVIYFSRRGASAGPDELLRACYHDKPLADRLVQAEKDRAPRISDREARKRALDRLYRDRAS